MTTASSRSLRSSIQLAEEWLNEIRELLGSDDETTFAVLRGTLQVLRDSLTVDEAVHLAAQLPMVLRGVYYSGWDPSKVPVPRDSTLFLEAVRERSGLRADGPHPLAAARAVVHVLDSHVTRGEMSDVFGQLPRELADTLRPQATS